MGNGWGDETSGRRGRRGIVWAAIGGALAVGSVGIVTWRDGSSNDVKPAVAAGETSQAPGNVGGSTERADRASPTSARTADASDPDVGPESVLDDVPVGDLPVIEPPSPTPPDEPSGVLVVSGASVFDTAAEGRIAYAGRAIEGQDLSVTGVAATGFWASVTDASPDRVFIAFGEAGNVRVRTGDRVSLQGLVRPVPDDFVDAGMTPDDLAELHRHQIYIHALSITTS